MTRTAKPGALGPDGLIRTSDAETKLNRLCAACFATEAGREVLTYLRKITIESVHGPAVQPHELMHREGMRYLVGIIEQRIARGHTV